MSDAQSSLGTAAGRRPVPGWLGWFLGMLACGALLQAAPGGAPAARQTLVAASRTGPSGQDEYRVKGAFLFKFVQYTIWPATAFARDQDPIVVVFLGSNPHFDQVEEVLRGRSLHGRALVARRARSIEQVAGAHIVYASEVERGVEERLIERFRGTPTLLLSDTEGFAQRGGTMNFFLQTDKVRFAINPKIAADAGLKISSELLKLARIEGGKA